jgi:threonine/homoserine/homoserine lactone efflux protein
MIYFTSPQFSIFFVAALVLAFTPGASITYVVSRTASGGIEAGMNSSFGTAAGGLVHVLAAALGISIIVSESAILFSLVKYIGACYLIYLVVRLILTKESLDLNTDLKPVKKSKLFWEGFTVEALNVKTAIFFLAFIPLFINPSEAVIQQFIIYGAICVALNTTADLIAVFGARALLVKLKSTKPINITSGSVLVSLGLLVAANDTKH